ncbi:MAG: GGDEF domain-containing protein, partial [Piscinibacter sp.]|nr:GGDEF domain-containing protein [Piscinibacter sp.]
KPINDRAGHAAGDAMLKAVAAAITARVRASDLVVRLGGDEFALLLERCTHETALRIAENVRRAITEIELPWDRHTLRVGASLGVASLGAETASVDAWLAQADAACYAAKAAGRGAVLAHRPTLRVVAGDSTAA